MDAPPPWRCELTALVWWRLLPARTPRLAVGALVHYTRTPVGPYCELLAALVVPGFGRPMITVPFLAVDSPASVEAGRSTWGLPKRTASFEGEPAAGSAAAASDTWALRATSATLGPPVPGLLLARLEQPAPEGAMTAPLTARGWARPARADVVLAASPDVPEWLPSGRCWAASVRGVLVLGEPDAR